MIFTGTGNANKIGGIPVQIGTPSDTFTLLYDAASRRWIFGPSGTPPAGGVGGSANLTTVGSVPFVTASGVLGQDADFSFASATDRLVVGNASVGSNASAYSGYAVWAHKDQQSAAGIALLQGPSGDTYLNSAAAAALVFRIGATEGFRLAHTTRNLLLGTTIDDGTSRLQVAGSGRFATTANGTPASVSLSATGTGSDAYVDTVGSGAYINLRSTLAGPYAGMQINRSTNTVLWFTGTQGLDSYGWFTGSSFTRLASLTTGGTLTLHNETPTTGSTSFVVRAGAGQGTNNLQEWQDSAGVAIGSISNNGTILARRVQSAGETVASLPAAAAGNAGTISYVTDSNSTTIGATVAGGGANRVLVWSNGTAWRIFAN